MAAVLAVSTLALSTVACSGPERTAADPLVVRLDSGAVRGVAQGGSRVFSGIRYAAPPVGALRWRDPRPVRPWPGVADATKPGRICPQRPIPGAPPPAEDCLTVNVTVPKNTAGRRLPVLLWWHGGGYVRDAGSLYGARRLAERGHVIVVTANYRLGVFGYFGYPGLPGSADFGFADQLAALRWTKRNAAAFGGDPGNITVAGQSAGGMSVCAALTSPAARGLMRRAIIDSGSCALDWPRGALFPGTPAQTPYAPVSAVAANGRALARSLGCAGKPDVLGCLRAKPVAALVPHNQEFSDQLGYGTPLLPRRPADALRAGQFARIPVLSAGTRDEQRSFVGGAAMIQPIDTRRYQELLRSAFGARAGTVAARYPAGDYASPALAWAAVTTDRAWSCPTLRANADMARHTTVYGYEFADEHAPNVNGIHLPAVPQGAAHASDLPSLFDLGGRQPAFTAAQRRLSERMIDYWASFAAGGAPSNPDSPRWQRFSGTGPILRLAPKGIRPADYAAEHRCGFWAALR